MFANWCIFFEKVLLFGLTIEMFRIQVNYCFACSSNKFLLHNRGCMTF